ncbi:MAG: CIA30 family protein [Chromatocurvus sp.]
MTLLIDFDDGAESDRWRAIHDRVMGGRSEGQLRCENGMAIFSGDLSLANNGGFASVRREPEALPLAGASGIRLHVRGDGRAYQLRLHTGEAFDGVAYRAIFETRRDICLTLALPWSGFEPVFRGRVLDAPPLQPAAVQQIGLMTADKQPGPFCLTLRAIESY